MATVANTSSSVWPPLPLDEWQDTCSTLHMMTQIVGKVRLAQAEMLNHWWHVPLYVTARGLTTSPMPYGDISFEINFDFISHQLRIQTSEDTHREIPLQSQTIAEFYSAFMTAMHGLGLDIHIWTMPVEIPDPIPFDQDQVHRTYVPEHARRFWQVLKQAAHVMQQYRCGYVGKCSPVHFFWGSFDLAVTRFSGRPAPQHPGGFPHLADWVTRMAYSHEVSSCGFWPGGYGVREPMFYAYAYPEPAGYQTYAVRPSSAYYSQELHEFLLPYESVRSSADPEAMILEFMRSTYEAAAEKGAWDRAALEYGLPAQV